MHSSVTVTGIEGLPLIQKGDDLPQLISERCALENGDIICIASTIISKAKGYSRSLCDVSPGQQATHIASVTGEDPRFLQVVLDQACDVLVETPFTLTELPFGHVGVRSGVDASNVEDGLVIVLPPDPMKEAKEVRESLLRITGKECGVIVTDTCGRSFRRGQTGHAIGWSGMTAIRDFRGDTDLFGRTLEITEEAVIDEISGFANLIMGESNNGIPAVHFRGIPKWTGHDNIYFRPEEDIIRKALKKM
ncbi:coenzyme F420-0:L-glutamate ligase [Methanospirillum stamsii]|uniref:Coenzyme F420-0:L-glutamate ligase n=1 Tax=Methanospirillum stamsii TaxID=1277351 RepID=A0A2V2NH47_9EURY|nr:coenzyme F420-0:L-glutamate ligase [Methanospirillum stamsii]PWR74931.1 coenzyme F420-0:L-glutamate ligase [Methanospirillum stamsii]